MSTFKLKQDLNEVDIIRNTDGSCRVVLYQKNNPKSSIEFIVDFNSKFDNGCLLIEGLKEAYKIVKENKELIEKMKQRGLK